MMNLLTNMLLNGPNTFNNPSDTYAIMVMYQMYSTEIKSIRLYPLRIYLILGTRILIILIKIKYNVSMVVFQ